LSCSQPSPDDYPAQPSGEPRCRFQLLASRERSDAPAARDIAITLIFLALHILSMFTMVTVFLGAEFFYQRALATRCLRAGVGSTRNREDWPFHHAAQVPVPQSPRWRGRPTDSTTLEKMTGTARR
jgi:hypothetical protein